MFRREAGRKPAASVRGSGFGCEEILSKKRRREEEERRSSSSGK
jgi:hypothetical protein